MTAFETGDRVRFSPPGFRRRERTGEVFETHTDGLHGTTLYIEDDAGRKYQLDSGAVEPTDERLVTDGGQSMNDSEFPFSEGDTVLVRVREHGTSGNIVVKFTAECRKIETFPTGRTQATFDLPGMMNSVSYATHEAEFEVVE